MSYLDKDGFTFFLGKVKSKFQNYYNKDATDDLLDTKQDVLEFDNTPIAGSSNPVTSAGIKTALDNILISGNGGSIIRVHHTAGSAAQGNIVTASKGSYSVSSTFDVSGDAIIIGFGEIGDVILTCTNGSETGTKVINLPCFSNYSTTIGYGLDYKSWLIEGGLNPSYYASLSDVLNDEEAVRRLMTLHSSVDYLASLGTPGDELAETVINNDICAKWINLRDYALDTLYANPILADLMDTANKYFYGEWALVPQIPPMSSATAPYGAVTTSSVYSTSWGYNWQAFDGTYLNGQDRWVSSASDTNKWIQYAFQTPVRISAINFRVGTSGEIGSRNAGITTTGRISGSNDGSTWKVLSTINFDASKFTEMCSLQFDNDTAYTYYRVNLDDGTMIDTNNNARYGQFAYLQFFAWGPKGNVPVMTAEALPYGAATASSTISGNNWAPWKAFDQKPDLSSTRDGWHAANKTSDQWLKYQFINPVCVKHFYIRNVMDNATTHIGPFILQASNDDINWTKLGDFTTIVGSYHRTDFDVENDNYYLFYRIYMPANTTTYTPCMSNMQYFGREMKVSVPNMTANTTPYGVASGESIQRADRDAYYAFDSDDSEGWIADQVQEAWVQYQFPYPVLIKKYWFRNRSYTSNSDCRTKKYRILGSDDNVHWTNLTEAITVDNTYDAPNVIYSGDLDTTHMYSYYRVQIYLTFSGAYAGIGTLQFYGFDYSEYDWDTNHPRHYIYDHGLEFEDIEPYIYGTESITAKEPDQLYVKDGNGTQRLAAFITKDLFDTADYNLLRCSIGNKLSTNISNQDFTRVGLLTQKPTTYVISDVAAVFVGSPPIKTSNFGLDISALNDSYYLREGNGTYSTSGYMESTITEWWVE